MGYSHLLCPVRKLWNHYPGFDLDLRSISWSKTPPSSLRVHSASLTLAISGFWK